MSATQIPVPAGSELRLTEPLVSTRPLTRAIAPPATHHGHHSRVSTGCARFTAPPPPQGPCDSAPPKREARPPQPFGVCPLLPEGAVTYIHSPTSPLADCVGLAMEVGALVIVHDLVSPEKPTTARFVSFGALSSACLIRFTGPRDARRTGFTVVSPSGRIPSGGTRFKIYARRAGTNRFLAASRTLSADCLRKAAEMISISSVRAGR
ncbi:hypothetical protein KPP03845_200105 (plasmid) [Streptomyces xanthophaeus]|nr:hypothetical protein KPP03845_200105 [Streptomyces xanthophaeus]